MLKLVMPQNPHTHGVDQGIAGVTLIKTHFTSHGRNSDTVSVSRDSSYNMAE
jgi:hypothetical protein